MTGRSERSDSRLASITRSSHSSPAPLVSNLNEEPYSRLVHGPHGPQPSLSPPVPNEYSKLEQTPAGDQPPPRPPKPSSTKPTSRTPPPPPPAILQNRESQIYSEPSNPGAIEKGVGGSSEHLPPVNIYRTLEGHTNRDSNEYDYARESGGWKVRQSEDEGGKGIFDDPEYSPLRGGSVKGRKTIEVLDPRYVGDYERSPTYSCPTVQVKPSDLDPKYRGDYEWDPTYVPKPPPRRASVGSDSGKKIPVPSMVIERRKSLEADALHKYSGDYERNPTYVPPPLLQNGNTKNETSSLEYKYTGDYERDPLYMANKLSANNSEYSAPYPNGDQTWADLVPPHIPHEYTALEDAMKNPPQQYARLTSEPPDTPPNTTD